MRKASREMDAAFAQMLLPTSVAAKGILWTILFGLAKINMEVLQFLVLRATSG